jgi:archaellum biogenesis ATPase FlaH
VSRTPPQKLKAKVPLGCGFLWLTKFESQEGAMKDYSVQPNDLIKLYTSVKKFMTDNKESKTVIMMDGVNILISNNDFNSVLKTIQKLKDDAFIYDSVLIISADPFSMLPNEVRLIENEMQNVYDAKAVAAMR